MSDALADVFRLVLETGHPLGRFGVDGVWPHLGSTLDWHRLALRVARLHTRHPRQPTCDGERRPIHETTADDHMARVWSGR